MENNENIPKINRDLVSFKIEISKMLVSKYFFFIRFTMKTCLRTNI